MYEAIAQYAIQKRFEKSKQDVIYFINNCCFTFDPRQPNKDIPFILYPYQIEYAQKLVKCIRTGQDIFVEKSRDMGVSWVTSAVILWFFIFENDFQCLLGSRKEDYVDNGQIDSLFGKLDYLIRHLNINFKFNFKKDRTFAKIINRNNGSTIIGESANQNFSRAGRYNCVFFDELAFWQFAQTAWESAGDSTPCRIAVTTPAPTPHYAKTIRNSGLIDVVTLHWTLHPAKSQTWYEEQKKRRTSDEVARELDINWEGSIKGKVYTEIEHAEIGNYPYIPNQPLYVSWDIGLDGTAIQWWQMNPNNSKWRLINSYFNTDKIIDFYLPFFHHPINSRFSYTSREIELIKIVCQYPIPTHFGDPDVRKRNMQTESSNREVLEKYGIYINTNTKSNDFESRKTETKRILQLGIEVNDNVENRFYIDCMRNARYPERSENSQSTNEIIKPVHDWTSHHRTSTEYFAVNISNVGFLKPVKKKERKYDAITGRLLS